MATIHEALALAAQEKREGNIAAYGTERNSDGEPVVWAESPDGGFYTWWSPDDEERCHDR